MGAIHRGYRYRLAPTPEQEILFRQFAGVCRLVYNLALEQRATWGRRHRLGFAQQCAELTQLRAQVEWIAAVNCACQQQALRDLDRAYINYFAGRTHYPRPRKKGDGDSFRFDGRKVQVAKLNDGWSAVRLPSIGWTRFRDTRSLPGKVRSATVRLDALGWHVSFDCEIEHDAPAPRPESVGIDRGVANALALSTGERLTLPASLSRIERQRRRAQRVAARRRKGSNRRRKALARVAKLAARQARIRRDFNHRAALDIARRFGTAVLEDLNTKGMTRSARGTAAEPGRNVRAKAGLNRAILNAGWGQFQTFLTYKMAERGGQVITVPARFTSQTCAACNTVDARSRESQARFRCVACGHADHADVNAAVNIERRGSTPSLRVEGRGCAPGEARTGRGRKAAENRRRKGAGMLNGARSMLKRCKEISK